MKNIKAINKGADYTVSIVNRSELTVLQERAYKFAESMLTNGTDMLKIEARSRLAANGLCFSGIYHDLNR